MYIPLFKTILNTNLKYNLEPRKTKCNIELKNIQASFSLGDSSITIYLV